jgi:hypothetical protein
VNKLHCETKPAAATDLFSEGEAAAYLHQQPRTLRLWRNRRGLPHFKPTSKVVLYRRADLDAWLENSRVAVIGGAA